MRILLGIILAIVLVAAGAWLGKNYYLEPPILMTQLVANMKDDTVIEHERDMVTWYRTCPKRINWHDLSPEILVIFPSTIRYELSLQNLSLPELIDGEWVVNAGPITADKPIIDTQRQTSLADGNPLTDESEYIARETARMSPIAEYLSLQQLQSEQSVIRKRMTLQIEKLIRSMHFAAQAANQNNNLNTTSPDLPIRVNWLEDEQESYLTQAKAELGLQPPFGIQGCSEDEWLQVNGTNTNVKLIAPIKKSRGNKSQRPSRPKIKTVESRYIVH